MCKDYQRRCKFLLPQKLGSFETDYGKEVMLMFKAPWVKISEQPLVNQPNQFSVNIKSLNEEEAILQFAESNIEFCATVHQPNQWQIGQQVWIHIDQEQIILAMLG